MKFESKTKSHSSCKHPLKMGRNICKVFLLYLLCFETSTLVKGDAEPAADPAPSPNANPNADADPDAQRGPTYGWGYPQMSYPQNSMTIPRNNYGPSDCEMTDRCCGMAAENCCFANSQEKCTTVWERKCDTEDQPECQLRVERHCHDIRVRDCRIVTEVAYRNFPITACYAKPLTKCFDYEKKVCSPSVMPDLHTITWVNEKLSPESETVKSHCFDAKTVNCTSKVVQETVTEQERKERKVKDTQRKCKMVQQKAPDQEIVVPVNKVVYKTMCYNVPRSSCSPNACSMNGYCGGDSKVCSKTEASSRTMTVCPESEDGMSSDGRTGCQQVRLPYCTGPGVCQSNYQQCCQITYQKVCRQVPQRSGEQSKRTIPGAVTWKEVCEDVPYERTEYYNEPVQKVVNRTKDNCEQITQPHCHNYTIPTFMVINETKSDKVTVTLPACNSQVIKDRYCHTFADGDVGCRNSTVRKGFRINKVVCDQMVTKPECFNIPIADCRVSQSANCKMVPRQVCQETCSNSSFCQQCDSFRNGPGFASCSATRCGNYYPKDQETLTPTSLNSGVVYSDVLTIDDGQVGQIEQKDGVVLLPEYTQPKTWSRQSYFSPEALVKEKSVQANFVEEDVNEKTED